MMLRLSFGCLIALLVCLTAMPSWAAITVDHAAVSTGTQGVTTITTSFTVGSCDHCLLHVCVEGSGSAGIDSSGVTFGGVALTSGAGELGGWGANETYVRNYYLLAPAISTADVVASWATTANDRSQSVHMVLLQGVLGLDANGTGASGSGTTATANITTLAANSMVVDCVAGDHSSGLTVDGSQNMQADRVVGAATDGVGTSTKTQVAAGATTMVWTQTSAAWVIESVSFAPFVGTSASRGTLTGVYP